MTDGLTKALSAATALLMAFSLAFACVEHAFAAEDERQTVRVGYYTGDPNLQDGFSDEERKSGYAYDYLQKIAPYAGWKYDYQYGTRDEAMDALLAGDVDIVAGVHKTDKLKDQLLFSENDLGIADDKLYFAVNPEREDLLHELNSAMAIIDQDDARFTYTLKQEYYGGTSAIQELSDNQREYLDELGTLKFGCIRDNLPVSGLDDNDELGGVAAVIADSLKDFLKIDVEPVLFDTTEEMIDALLNGQVDVLFPLYADSWLAESRGIFETDPLVNDRVLIAYLGEYREDLMDRVAVSYTGLGQRYYLEEYYPDSELLNFDTRFECLDAVMAGDADCIIGAASVMQRFIALHSSDFPDFNIAYLDGSEEFSLAVDSNNTTLVSIITKASYMLNKAEITNAMVRFSYVDTPTTLMDIVQEYAAWFILDLLLILAIVIIVVARWRRRTNIFNREQEKSRKALEEALAAADAASEAKTTFLSSMSHDIRTPMNGIIGMTAIAAANINDADRVKDCLTKITSSSHHLLALINEILDVSKIESGKFELNDEDFSISEMLADLVVLNKGLADAKNQTFSVNSVNVTHENVIGDKTRLQQVFTNLVSNAVKYTEPGGTIDVTLVERSSGSPKVACFDFVVEDNGIGMNEEYLPKVFDAFSRDSGKTVARTQGTGLGLPIARNIVRMMNGDITVESTLGVGSKFTATVFLRINDEEQMTYEEFLDLNVLMVDDDQVTCESTCLMLNQLGMNPQWTLSGREAVEIAYQHHQEQNDFFAIIVDWVMPDMNGEQTCIALRERIGDEVPIIVVSAYDWAEIEQRAKQAGAVTFVSKPLFKSNLVRLFSELLGEPVIEEEKDLNDITSDTPFEGRRALLAEDNDLNAEIAIEFLGMTGLTIERAVNGQKAVEMFEAAEPGYYDWVFMDLQMPVMNGLEATEAIRNSSHADAADIPIFAMTADAFVDDIKATREAGMQEHFAKPLDFDLVVQTLRKYL